ncbi:interleukin-12 subunit alpha [Centroberyx affinis]|uniref:interleukin-12 subunit alpha n=1 Tax=Centroberyx affinis TaxID=166261 RepID=UPI003A5BD54A
MANFNLYFTSCALLLAVCWRASTGIPVPTPLSLSAEKCALCSTLSKALLQNITQLLNNEELFHGVRCPDQTVVNNKAETALTCAPILTQISSCTAQNISPFSESKCLEKIMKDLAYYAAVIQSYQLITATEAALLDPTLEIIQRLLEKCFLMPAGERESSEENVSQMWGNESYNNRLEMCKVMKGFHIRTITINRAMGYISSGDHRQ